MHFALSGVGPLAIVGKERAGLDEKTYVLDTCVLLADPGRLFSRSVGSPKDAVEELFEWDVIGMAAVDLSARPLDHTWERSPQKMTFESCPIRVRMT